MAVTTPVEEPIVAIEVELLDHEPPLVESVRVNVPPTQAVDGPEMAEAPALTVTE
jgi:hypothetical protein